MPWIFQEFRGARQRKILRSHLRAAMGPPHDMRITKTADDQLTEDMVTPTRTSSLPSPIK